MIGKQLNELFGTHAFEATEDGDWVTTEALRVWVASFNGWVSGSGWRRDESGS